MSWMRTFRARPLFALLLCLLVLAAGVVAVGAHHEHEAASHHGDCLTCRLADEAAGALPVLAVASVPIQPAAAVTIAPPDVVPTPVRVRTANPLRGPPIA
jgi:hypothetical protein